MGGTYIDLDIHGDRVLFELIQSTVPYMEGWKISPIYLHFIQNNDVSHCLGYPMYMRFNIEKKYIESLPVSHTVDATYVEDVAQLSSSLEQINEWKEEPVNHHLSIYNTIKKLSDEISITNIFNIENNIPNQLKFPLHQDDYADAASLSFFAVDSFSKATQCDKMISVRETNASNNPKMIVHKNVYKKGWSQFMPIYEK